MKRLWKVLLPVVVVVVVASVVVTVVASSATAGGPTLPHGKLKVGGMFSSISSIEDPNPAIDGNTLTMVNLDVNQVHGSFEGFTQNESKMTLDMQSGKFTFEGVECFTGTLNGVAGSLVSKMTGSGQFTDTSGTSFVAHGDSTFVESTGGLAVIKGGTLSFEETVTNGQEAPIAYTGYCLIR
jgi:hypothetical protein